MSHGKLPCPECETMNDAPEAGTKKITCSSCGVILVLNKVYGDNWPAQAKKHGGAAKAPSKPKIVSRRTKGRSEDQDEAAPSRKSKGSSSRRPSTRGRAKSAAKSDDDDRSKTRSRRKSGGDGVSNGMIFGSIGAFIATCLIVFLVYQNQEEKKAAKIKEAAALEQKEKDDKAAKLKKEADEMAALDDGDDLTDVTPDTTEEETPVAVKKKPVKKKRIARKRDPFPEPTMTPEVADAINKAMVVLQDPDATRTRRTADDTLFEHRKEAIPLLINKLMAIDARNEAAARGSYSLMESLRRCSEFSTKYDRNLLITTWPTDEKQLESEAKDREIVVLEWWKWWDKNKDTWKPPVDSEEDF